MIRGAAGDRGYVHGWHEAHLVRAHRVSLRLVARLGDDPSGRCAKAGTAKNNTEAANNGARFFIVLSLKKHELRRCKSARAG